jgi:hypothetical protein
MPRGNDGEAAAVELQRQYGEFDNADDLIVAQAAKRSKTLDTAQYLGLNEEETEALDLDEIAASLADGETLLSASIRGRGNDSRYLVLNIGTPDGRNYKVASVVGDEPEAEGGAAESDEEREAREAAEAAAAAEAEAQAQAEAEAQAAAEAEAEAARIAEEEAAAAAAAEAEAKSGEGEDGKKA